MVKRKRKTRKRIVIKSNGKVARVLNAASLGKSLGKGTVELGIKVANRIPIGNKKKKGKTVKNIRA